MTHRFIKNRDIILFSSLSWNSEIAFNFRDMAYELARHNRILFVDRASDRNTVLRIFFSGKKKDISKKDALEKIVDNFWVLHPHTTLESGNWFPNYKLFDFFNRINNKRLSNKIKIAIKELAFRNCILINDNDFFRGLYLNSLLPIHEYIFYLRDFLTIQPYYKRHGPRCEMEMIQKSDLVVANSSYLANYASRWNPNSVDIGQGCNLTEFIKDDLPVPNDIKHIPEPIIGYCGAISSMRLDQDLLLHIAFSLPEMSLLLVGPLDRQFQNSSLHKLKNVFFTGVKNPEIVANYIHHFSVCINPQLINPLTIGNYPRKIDEYLACGKPVVATNTQAMELFQEYCELCDTKEEFVVKIRKLILSVKDESAELKKRREEYALSHSWENSVGAMGDAFYFMEKSIAALSYEK
jgi:teichuronic acid biosynthesis glycosyltransferase TuaH